MVLRLPLIYLKFLRNFLQLLPQPPLIILRFLMQLINPTPKILLLLQIRLQASNFPLQDSKLLLIALHLNDPNLQPIQLIIQIMILFRFLIEAEDQG